MSKLTIPVLWRLRQDTGFRSKFDPTTGTYDLSPAYRIVLERTLHREARRMKRALYFKIFLLELRMFRIQLRNLRFLLARKLVGIL